MFLICGANDSQVLQKDKKRKKVTSPREDKFIIRQSIKRGKKISSELCADFNEENNSEISTRTF